MGERDADKGRAILTATGILLLSLAGHGQQTTVPTSPQAHTQPTHRAAPPRQTTRTTRSAVQTNPSDILSGAPQPTWELPKNITPHWEIPPYNNVQPNPVQGNPRYPSSVGYGAPPYYSFVDPYAVTNAGAFDASTENGASQIDQGGSHARRRYTPSGVSPTSEETEQHVSGRTPYHPGRDAKNNNPGVEADQTDGLEHPEITLVFKDGRPAKKVRSYVLTGSKILAIENGHQSVIPIADLNLSATMEQNRAAGVDFALPGGTR